ncbi:MAG: Crp/Fnr family transcriptional regulator [Candidatus Binataceae bacterium]
MRQELPAQGLAQGRERLVARLESCGLPRAAIDALLSRHTLVRYPKDMPLFTEGSPADVIFAVMGGIVKIYCAGSRGNRILVGLAGAGDLVGYADFGGDEDERAQMFEAEAFSSAAVALFTRDHILRVLRSLDAGTVLKLTESVNFLWASIVHRYACFLGMSLRERLESVFAEMAERFGLADARGVMLTPEIGQEALAEMIGGSRPMVSKLLAEMMRQGVILRDGRHYIVRRPPATSAKDTPQAPERAPGANQRGGTSAA